MGDETKRDKRNSHIEAMAATTAIVVSLASLYVAIRQTYVMERQLQASVWPSLVYDTNNTGDDGKPAIGFALKNGGVGPARVRSLEVSYQGKPVPGAIELLSECCALKEHPEEVHAIHMTFAAGRLLPAGQAITFLRVDPLKDEDPLFSRLDAVRFEVDGKVCYCSALDQCWTLGFHEHEPTSVHDCVDASKRPQYEH